jgi:nitrogen regulation protein NR(I)
VSSILVVDDDPSVLSALAQLLSEQGHDVRTLMRATAALDSIAAAPPELVIMDIRMPGLSGLDAFQQIRQRSPRLPVIIMTGYATMETAVEATKLGVFDYQVKPLDPEEMLRSVSSALEGGRLMARGVRLDDGEEQSESVSVPANGGSAGASPSATGAPDALVGRSRAMQEVYKAIGRVARTNASVLIRGETGTGKELVARAIYQHSTRADAPLVVLNCAAVPEMLLESELFGHERGAFTGAVSRRIGRLEKAHGGTLFLDEIGDMPPSTQAKLLRVLQDRTFERVGGNEPLRVDLRLLAATNRNLERAIAEGRFREDLFHRLKVFSIEIPPLRERCDDVPRLVAYFVGRFARELGIDPPLIAPEAMDLLRRYSWPGNVRELEHSLYRALILTHGYPIQGEDIRTSLQSETSQRATPAEADAAETLRQIVLEYLRSHSGEATHSDFIERIETLLLTETLKLTRGNQTHAARWLGLARPTLKAKMDRYGLGNARDPA